MAQRCASKGLAVEILATERTLASQGHHGWESCLTTLDTALKIEVLFAVIEAHLQPMSAQGAKRTTVEP